MVVVVGSSCRSPEPGKAFLTDLERDGNSLEDSERRVA